jgi:transcriptional regulator with XRE-family HTH domain
MGNRAAGAATLKRLRHSRGLSLAAVARALSRIADALHQPRLPAVASVQRSVARWESAAPPLPDERYQLLLAHLYARTPAGQMAVGAGSDLAELLGALLDLGESETRVAFLRTALIRTATDTGGMLALLSPHVQADLSAALVDPSQATEETSAGLAAVVADVNAQVGSVPMVRLQLLLAPVIDACRRLQAGPLSGPVAGHVRAVSVAACSLAGRLAFENRDDRASQALYAEATAQAEQLGNTWLRASVHMSHALVTLYSSPHLADAQRLVDQAVHAAGSGDSVQVRARAHALQAEIAARAGSERQAQAALGLAWYDIEGRRGDDPSGSTFSAGHLRGFEGVCQLYVGDPSVAHDRFADSAATLTAPREQVQRAIVRTDQALARIRMGDPRSAAELLHECVLAAVATGGRVPAIRLRRARVELRPWRREDFVADLDDHLMDVLGA